MKLVANLAESCFRTVIVDQVFLVCITLFSQLFMTMK